MLAYSVSKAAVIAMTKVQGKEYAETGITVNAIAPAVIRTEMVAALPEEQVKYMTDKADAALRPSRRVCSPLRLYCLAGGQLHTGFTFDLTGGRATY